MVDEVASLRKSLRRQARLAAETALRDAGDTPPERLEALRRLQSLIEIAEGQHSDWTGKWLPALALLASLGAASVLLFIHLRTVEIELDAVVSELSFAMESAGPLLPGMNVSDIAISGSQTVELPDVPPLAGPRPISSAAAARIRLTLGHASRGNITLSSFLAPKDTQVRLQAVEAPNHYRVILQTPPDASTAIQLSCRGEIAAVISGTARAKLQYRFDIPQAVISQSSPGQEISLDLSFPNGGEIVLNPQLAASHLSFQHVEHNLNSAGARYLSTIASGELFIESLNGLKRGLRSGDALRFASSTGEMRRLSLHGGAIHAQFQGSVQGMTSGVENTPVNLMPSLLEWLRARHGLYLMWGTALYLFGVLTAVWRWFGAAR